VDDHITIPFTYIENVSVVSVVPPPYAASHSATSLVRDTVILRNTYAYVEDASQDELGVFGFGSLGLVFDGHSFTGMRTMRAGVWSQVTLHAEEDKKGFGASKAVPARGLCGI